MFTIHYRKAGAHNRRATWECKTVQSEGLALHVIAKLEAAGNVTMVRFN